MPITLKYDASPAAVGAAAFGAGRSRYNQFMMSQYLPLVQQQKQLAAQMEQQRQRMQYESREAAMERMSREHMLGLQQEAQSWREMYGENEANRRAMLGEQGANWRAQIGVIGRQKPVPNDPTQPPVPWDAFPGGGAPGANPPGVVPPTGNQPGVGQPGVGVQPGINNPPAGIMPGAPGAALPPPPGMQMPGESLAPPGQLAGVGGAPPYYNPRQMQTLRAQQRDNRHDIARGLPPRYPAAEYGYVDPNTLKSWEFFGPQSSIPSSI